MASTRVIVSSLVSIVLLAPNVAGLRPDTPSDRGPSSLLLITLDTTRRDALGAYGASGAAATTNLDRLAASGVRYLRAVAPSPLTLPAHASLLTGLDPNQHGIRVNGETALPAEVRTLAEVLRGAGFETAAVVGSLVLDRRFGLARGFDTYDDTMVSERVGQYGHPERPADQVTDAAMSWLDRRRGAGPFFLWVHYYDPHAPYKPPAEFGGPSDGANYLGEVAFVDREIGRLLARVRASASRVVVAVVGDHGEALGDHGERTHGIFLYSATIEVPLMISGPGIPVGKVVAEPVATSRLASTLASVLGIEPEHALAGAVLPLTQDSVSSTAPVYSEAMMPARVYGWSALYAVTSGRWRLIDAPRPELYDLATDPDEERNLVSERPEVVSRLQPVLKGFRERPPIAEAPVAAVDGAVRQALIALGYAEAGGGAADDGIDPKDGIELLAVFEQARKLLETGQPGRALELLDDLVARNPANLPFQNRLAQAQLATGHGAAAVATLRSAVRRNPRSVFLMLALGDTLRAVGQSDEAGAAYRGAIAIDPRFAPAWLALADLVGPDGRPAVLRRANESGVVSLEVLVALATIEAEAGRVGDATALLDRAQTLEPESAAVHLGRARLLETEGSLERALESCAVASELEPANPLTALCTGRIYLALDEPERARPHLMRAAVLGQGTDVETEARQLMAAAGD